MKTLIPSKIFVLIHDHIIVKCQKESGFDFLGKGEGLYGFGRFKEEMDTPSIRNQMIKHPEIAIILEKGEIKTINGKYLYDRMREAQARNSTSISMTLSYLKTYMKFIGYDSYEEFVRQIKIEGKIKESDLPADSYAASHIIESPSESILYFTGYYYSLKNNQVQTYELEIDKFKNEALIRGLHDSYTQTGGDSTPYIGEFETLGDNLWAELRSKLIKNNKISLLIHNQEIPIEEHYLCRGIVSTISAFNSPFVCETLIAQKIKNENEHWISNPEKEIFIHQYLNLQHSSITIPSRVILHETYLLPQKKPISALKPLVGYYNAWSFSYYSKDASKEQIKLYKSKIAILDDYSSYLISAYGHDENSGRIPINCFLSLTEIANVNYHNLEGSRKVSITTLDDNSHIKSHAMMVIPAQLPTPKKIKVMSLKEKEETKKAYTYLKGVYCSFGTRKRPFLASALLFQRLGMSKSKTDLSPINKILAKKKFNEEEVGTFSMKELKKDYKDIFDQLVTHYKNTTIQADPEPTPKTPKAELADQL